MSKHPNIWDQILPHLGLQSLEGIENITNILAFLGYTTLQTISQLRKQNELNLFQIEVAKLNTNTEFCAKYPELKNWRLNFGTIQVVKDISNAAVSCVSYDSNVLVSVQKTMYERCKDVS